MNHKKIDPPIQTEYLRSGGAMILIFMVDGAKAVNSLVLLSGNSWEHGGTSRKDDVSVQIFTDQNDCRLKKKKKKNGT